MRVENNRSSQIDIARAIGILLVVYAHALELAFKGNPSPSGLAFLQWKFIYSFHMPLFYFISGTLFKKKDLKSALSGSINLIFVAQVFHIIGWLLFAGFGKSSNLSRPLVQPLLLLTDFTIVPLWFLVSLAIIQMMIHVAKSKGALPLVLVGTATVVTFLWCNLTKTNAFQMGSLLPGLIFYWLGSEYNTHILTYSHTRATRTRLLVKSTIFTPIAAALMIVPIFENNGCLLSLPEKCSNIGDQFGVLLALGQTGFFPYFLLSAALGCVAIFSIADAASRLPSRLEGGLAYVGKHSLEMLIVNGFTLVFLQPQILKHMSVWPGSTHSSFLALLITLGHLATLPIYVKIFSPVLSQIAFASREAADQIAQKFASLPVGER
jgi:fucose 4-O-acetylase-like acetyltransferase